MSDIFNKKRFVNTLKLDLATNWRRWSIAFFGALAGLFCTFMGMTSSIQGFDNEQDAQESALSVMTGVSYFGFVLYFILCGSMMFNNMRSKRTRISFLMLPASNLEKFLSRWLMSTVGTMVAFVAALATADAARALFDLALGINPYSSVTLRFFGGGWMSGFILDFFHQMLSRGFALMLVFGLSCLLVSHSVFVLGGALFRRHSILLTILALVALSFVQGFSAPFSMLFFGSFGNMTYGDDGFQTSLCVRGAINVIIAVACYWGAYRLFCRSQVITHKWINL